MPMDLGNLTTDSAEARIDYGAAGDVNIVFRPRNITEATFEQLRAVQTRGTDLATATAMNAILAQVVLSWDLTRQGEPVALTEEELRTVPLEVRIDVLEAILEAVRLNPKLLPGSPSPVPATPAPAGRVTSPKRASQRSRRN